MKSCHFTNISCYGPHSILKLKGNAGGVIVLSDLALDYKKCSGCGFHFNLKEISYIKHGVFQNTFLCAECYENIIKCRECGNRKHISEFDGNACYECNRKKIIKNFNCRAQRYLGFLSKNGLGQLINSDTSLPKTLYYGVELELQINNPMYARNPDGEDSRVHRRTLAQYVWKNIGSSFSIIKHDGSVGYGFEIVTAPATLDVQKENWKNFFDWLDQSTKGNNGIPYFNINPDTCGMHIHASRDALSKLLIGKIMSFIYEKKNSKFISQIAQRQTNHYSDWNLDKKVTDVLKPTGVKYEALNLNNKKTIELRIFQAELKKESFFKNLEFFDALIDFCKNTSISDSKSYIDFIAFVNKRQKIYPYLNDFINRNVAVE